MILFPQKRHDYLACHAVWAGKKWVGVMQTMQSLPVDGWAWNPYEEMNCRARSLVSPIARSFPARFPAIAFSQSPLDPVVPALQSGQPCPIVNTNRINKLRKISRS
jgi:hypothetical protein